MQEPLVVVPLREYQELKLLSKRSVNFNFVYKIQVNERVVHSHAERINTHEEENSLIDVTKIFEYGQVIRKAVQEAVEIKNIEIQKLKEQLNTKNKKWYQKIF